MNHDAFWRAVDAARNPHLTVHVLRLKDLRNTIEAQRLLIEELQERLHLQPKKENPTS